jgi:hypothetical protein
MSYPKLEIYLNEASEICIAKVETADSPSEIFVEIELDELKAQGIDGASHQLGFGIITSLKRWHAKEFDSWDPNSAVVSTIGEELQLAHRLIDQSIKDRTAVHIQSIDALLYGDGKNDPDSKSLLENWPVIRQRLTSFAA